MKNLLPALFITVIFTACKSETKNDPGYANNVVPLNTAGYNMNDASTDISKPGEDAEYFAPERKRKAQRKYSAIQQVEYIPKQVEQQTPAPVNNTTTTLPNTTNSPAPQSQQTETSTASSTGSGSSTSGGTANNTNGSGEETASIPKKKGWSDAAKGAVIGGAAGAIGGAIINGKNRGKGAIIGAVLGAAGGYVIGRKRDKNKQEINQYSMVVN